MAMSSTVVVTGSRALAQQGDVEPVSRQEHEQLLKELDEVRRDLDEIKRRAGLLDGEPGGGFGAVGESVPGHKGGVFDKPFLRRTTPQVYVGGYFDVEFRDARNQSHETRFHRFIPFFYADIHERIKFAAEVEFEDGEDVAIEFAFLDFLIMDQANFRGGVILDPLGKFNLIHDSPINDLTDRPLVNQFVIPTTLREIGAGLFGTLTPPEALWEIKYEAYLVTGFKGLGDDGTAEFSSDTGIRDGRPHKDVLGTRNYEDNNNAFAGVGRLSLSPALGTELGLSAYHGTYDDSSNNDLTILAVDGLYTVPQFHIGEVPVGPIEFQGEAAYDFIERDTLARDSGVPSDIWGYYGQMNYHFMPAFLQDNLGAIFIPGSILTFVTRWGQIDLDGQRRRRLTLGLNFRPVESTAIKFDYQFNRATGDTDREDEDDAFLISLTSYF